MKRILTSCLLLTGIAIIAFSASELAAQSSQICGSGTPQELFFDGFENGAGNWKSKILLGSQDPWSIFSGAGLYVLWGNDLSSPSLTCKEMTVDVAIPANAYLYFLQKYDFDSYCLGTTCYEYYDGSIVEYSTDGGSTWYDAGSLFIENGYNATIYDDPDNPLGGSAAFSFGGTPPLPWIESLVDLSTLAGQNVRFRFCIGTNNYNYADEVFYGWAIDEVYIYNCNNTGTTTIPPTTTTSIASTTTSSISTTTTSVSPSTTTSSVKTTTTTSPTTTTSSVSTTTVKPTTTTSVPLNTTTTLPPTADSDGDGILNEDDNCPSKPNGYQLGSCSPWSGSPGVVCESDNDCTATCTGFRACNKNQEDTDNDGVGDVCDNCPSKPNGYVLGSCSPRSGSSGVACESDNDCTANCTGVRSCNKNQEDKDNDGVGDVCDNCYNKCNVQQLDADRDGRGDVCDPTPGCGGCLSSACEVQC